MARKKMTTTLDETTAVTIAPVVDDVPVTVDVEGTAVTEEPPHMEEVKTIPVVEPVESLMETLKSILNVPFTASDIPVLISYTPAGEQLVRYVLLEIPQSAVSKGWTYYRSQNPNAKPDDYLNVLYAITGIGVKKPYKSVYKIHLD